MRAIGVTNGRIKFLYFYEASILVLASCILGVMIGFVVGTTLSMQQNLFLDTTMTFFFPWQ